MNYTLLYVYNMPNNENTNGNKRLTMMVKGLQLCQKELGSAARPKGLDWGYRTASLGLLSYLVG